MAVDPIDETIDALHKAGASDDEITEILKEKFGKAKSAPAVKINPAAVRARFEAATPHEPTSFWGGVAHSAMDQGIEALPAIGGTIGATATAAIPGASIIGAAAGGAGGAAVRDMINAARGEHVSARTAGDVAKNMAIDGAIQGAVEGTMKGAKVGLKKLAPAVYEMGLNRTPAMKADIPQAANVGLEHKVIPTPARAQAALSKVEGELNAAGQAYDTANPASIDPRTIADRAKDFAVEKGRVMDRGVRDKAINEMLDRHSDFMMENTKPLSTMDALSLKRAEQQLADPAYHGRTVPSDETLFHEGLGTAARESLPTGMKDALSTEQGLIGVLDGAKRGAQGGSMLRHMLAASTGGMLAPHSIPAALLAAGTIEGLRNPVVMGSAGIGMNEASKALGTPAERAIRAAFMSELMNRSRQDDEEVNSESAQ